jgi:hypothetical protein
VEVQVLSPVLIETQGLGAILLQVLFAFHTHHLKQIRSNRILPVLCPNSPAAIVLYHSTGNGAMEKTTWAGLKTSDHREAERPAANGETGFLGRFDEWCVVLSNSF